MQALNSRPSINTLLRTLLIAASAVIIVAGMRALSNIISALVLAVLIGTICIPLENWFISKGMRQIIAFVVTLVISLMVGIGVILFLTFSVLHVIQQLPDYGVKLRSFLDTLVTMMNGFGITTETLQTLANNWSNAIIQIALQILRSVLGAFSGIFLMYLFLFYILMEDNDFGTRITRALGQTDPVIARARRFIASSRRYIILRTFLGAVIAFAQTIMMLIMGVDFALLWGMVSFFCNYIPNIGFIISVVPPAILLFLEQGLVPTIIFVLLFTVINNVIENWVSPRFIGGQVDISPLSVSISIIFWTWVLGPLGAILALPMTLFVKEVLLASDTDTNMLVALMSATNNQPAEPPLAEEISES